MTNLTVTKKDNGIIIEEREEGKVIRITSSKGEEGVVFDLHVEAKTEEEIIEALKGVVKGIGIGFKVNKEMN